MIFEVALPEKNHKQEMRAQRIQSLKRVLRFGESNMVASFKKVLTWGLTGAGLIRSEALIN